MSLLASLAYPQIDPVALRIGPVAVHWYGLAYVAGFIAGGFSYWWFGRRWKLGLTDDDVITIVLGAVLGVLIGSRVGYVIFYGGERYLRAPLDILRVWDGGMSFHGGLAGILIAGAILSWRLKMPWLTLADMGAVAAPLGFMFGRMANFVNGELWGRVTTAPWGMVFPGAGDLPRHPSQLYESALEGLVLFVVVVVLALKLPPRPRGIIFGSLLTLYAAFRIGVEFFREPDAQIGFLTGGVTMGQVLSAPVLLAGIFVLVWASRRKLPPAGPERHVGQAATEDSAR